MPKETAKTMYLSKYALTTGIKETQAIVFGGGYAREVDGWWTSYKIGRDIHDTHAGAVVTAEAARLKKIKSLKAQIKKLEALSFAEKKDGAA